jgi:cellulose synthase/poly-beta-1,6-N-acetylglucosamine synthase-like glycosyltransferase
LSGLDGVVAAILVAVLTLIGLVIVLYTARHYLFTLNRLLGHQRHPYLDIQLADWPHVTILIPAHNEEAVITHILEALLEADYPADRLRIIPINDRSTDRTKEMVDAIAAEYPDRIHPIHRTGGTAGKSAALREATSFVTSDVILVFDADYLPGTGLIKQLVAPFFDPEVGAVMGRVVPLNVNRNLLTRLLDLERSGGYQVDQQARMNLGLVPQYGGTVGGVRKTALEAAGGWNDYMLAEDTDITFRLLLNGWQIVYQNRSECYEEVPETWPARVRQIQRWARGHNQVMRRVGMRLVRSPRVGLFQRIDGAFLLGVYVVAPLVALGWVLTLALFYLGEVPFTALLVTLAVASYGTLGNAAAFFEVAAAVRIDGSRERMLILPFLISGFLVSLVSVCRASVTVSVPWRRRRVVWHKTQRFRREGDAEESGYANGNGNGNGKRNGNGDHP